MTADGLPSVQPQLVGSLGVYRAGAPLLFIPPCYPTLRRLVCFIRLRRLTRAAKTGCNNGTLRRRECGIISTTTANEFSA